MADIRRRISHLITDKSAPHDAAEIHDASEALRITEQDLHQPSPENTAILPHHALHPDFFCQQLDEVLSAYRATNNSQDPQWVNVTAAMLPDELRIGSRRILLSYSLLAVLLDDADLNRETIDARGFVDSFISNTLLDNWLGFQTPYITKGEDKAKVVREREIVFRVFKNEDVVAFCLQAERPLWLPDPNHRAEPGGS